MSCAPSNQEIALRIFRFGDVEKALNMRDNIILMVDEAHRTQEGDLGEKMRLALPNAFFFGLTGSQTFLIRLRSYMIAFIVTFLESSPLSTDYW